LRGGSPRQSERLPYRPSRQPARCQSGTIRPRTTSGTWILLTRRTGSNTGPFDGMKEGSVWSG
jgi:hypothetical protein